MVSEVFQQLEKGISIECSSLFSSALKMKAIAHGSLASWVIKAFHSAVPYSNEEQEISL